MEALRKLSKGEVAASPEHEAYYAMMDLAKETLTNYRAKYGTKPKKGGA